MGRPLPGLQGIIYHEVQTAFEWEIIFFQATIGSRRNEVHTHGRLHVNTLLIRVPVFPGVTLNNLLEGQMATGPRKQETMTSC